ncbi:adenylate kinase [Thermodesulfitimonas autotrophica]|uniref:Adenylate kinase n=1 Tax=Thermodesulfitimonas autotrophica TaxID=1894989 RepID=A0A3N5B106_9THEO|nr:adenylate kinase [Thermodesulfitimonas autotrophica]RPF49310.1 adenylate kinase [Thermodesulfitimonas autotrophica]
MNLLIMGPPGAGKGTQAAEIVKELKIPHISTGDMLREAVKQGTEMGKKAKEYMDKGQLVPDEVIIGVVKERLGQPDCKVGFLLDGFPRTLPQAEALDQTLKEMGIKLDAVINIRVPREKIVDRITGRRVCRSCGDTYHVVNKPPKESGKCDKCGGELYQRSDDTAETVNKRLDVYEAQTQPLLDYYGKQGIVLDINGDQPINKVLEDILSALKKR